jgi:hypothetical protein
MSDALLKAKQHFANFRSPEKLLEIKVPEWDGMSIWYWPHLSLGERRAVQNAGQLGMTVNQNLGDMVKVDSAARQAMEVIVRARDEHGRLIFEESEFTGLMQVDPGVVARISNAMMSEYSDVENVEKN